MSARVLNKILTTDDLFLPIKLHSLFIFDLMKVNLFVFLVVLVPPIIGFGIAYLTDAKELGVLAWIAVLGGIALTFNRLIKSDRKDSYLGSKEEFVSAILMLVSWVIKSDGEVKQSEVTWIQNKLKRDFKERYAEQYIEELSGYLKEEQDLKISIGRINQKFRYSEKVQLLHYLSRLCIVDKQFSEKEYEVLLKITRLLKLNPKVLDSVLAMLNVQREKKQEKKSYSRSRSQSSKLSLQVCYQILEIDPSVSDKMVKKAFRRLATIHHPDKVAHLGEEFQKDAVEKFQKISDAYEAIKAKRGFK